MLTMAFKGVKRHGVPARRADQLDVEPDDSTRSRLVLGRREAEYVLHRVLAFQDFVELGRTAFEDLAFSKEAQDPWRTLEGLEHDRQTTVAGLVYMGYGLVSW